MATESDPNDRDSLSFSSESVGVDGSVDNKDQKWESLNKMEIPDFIFQRNDQLYSYYRCDKINYFDPLRDVWIQESLDAYSERDWSLYCRHMFSMFAVDADEDTIWMHLCFTRKCENVLSKIQIRRTPPEAQYGLQATDQMIPIDYNYMDRGHMLVVGDMVHIVGEDRMEDVFTHIMFNKHSLKVDPRSGTVDSIARDCHIDNFICVNETLYLFGSHFNVNSLFTYSLEKKEWNKLEARNQDSKTLGMIFCGSCAIAMSASPQERYIVIFRGFEPMNYHQRNRDEQGTDRIVVYDVHQNIFKKCSLKLPSFVREPDNHYNAVIVRSRNKEDLATIGFIRRLYKTEEFSDVKRVPDVIKKLMCQWMLIEYVHIVQKKQSHWIYSPVQHFQIAVDDIMESIVSDQ